MRRYLRYLLILIPRIFIKKGEASVDTSPLLFSVLTYTIKTSDSIQLMQY